MLANGKNYNVPQRAQIKPDQPRNKSAYLASSMPKGYATGGARSIASSQHGGTRRHLYSNSASSCSLIYDPQKMVNGKSPISDQADDYKSNTQKATVKRDRSNETKQASLPRQTVLSQSTSSQQQAKQPAVKRVRAPSRTPAEAKPSPINKDLLDYFSNHELSGKHNLKGRFGIKTRA